MHVHKNVKSIKKWNTASSALKYVEDLLKNVAKWLDKHTTSKWRILPDFLQMYD
jgi:hemerythrin